MPIPSLHIRVVVVVTVLIGVAEECLLLPHVVRIPTLYNSCSMTTTELRKLSSSSPPRARLLVAQKVLSFGFDEELLRTIAG